MKRVPNTNWSHLKANIAGRKLRLAANMNNAEGLERLLASGAGPNGTDEHRRTALHFGAAKGYTEVRLLSKCRGVLFLRVCDV